MPLDQDDCASCWYSQATDTTWLICRRYPPTPVANPLAGDATWTVGRWPAVLPGDLCGEFNRDPQAKP